MKAKGLPVHVRDFWLSLVRQACLRGPEQIRFAVPEHWIQAEMYGLLRAHGHDVPPGEPGFKSDGTTKSGHCNVDLCLPPDKRASHWTWFELKVHPAGGANTLPPGIWNMVLKDMARLFGLRLKETAAAWRKSDTRWYREALAPHAALLEKHPHEFVCALLVIDGPAFRPTPRSFEGEVLADALGPPRAKEKKVLFNTLSYESFDLKDPEIMATSRASKGLGLTLIHWNDGVCGPRELDLRATQRQPSS